VREKNNDVLVTKIHRLANGFANSHIGDRVKSFKSVLIACGTDGISDDILSREIGKLLAIGYAKGYDDGFKDIQASPLIL